MDSDMHCDEGQDQVGLQPHAAALNIPKALSHVQIVHEFIETLCLAQVLTPAAVAASVQFATHLGSPRPSHSEGRSGESSRVFFHGASDMSMLSTSPTCTTCCCTSLSRAVCEDGALRTLTAESIPPLPPLLHLRSMPRTVVNAAVVGEGALVAHEILASNSNS
mmetsp:Transcript_60558/g.171501  ORF Transcript_60558/g.171501 Transcript_60558/m.171501 type:complete len:164 (-) Transcript_60558:65-556(-)|eukprot:CAMPEP_0177310880 /NCGR_PEP_ID=MMETSP0368-20130122/10061_1 /TAXON_ID=447022 ORGANISM="Scrippsiella hangoei-like, Strain SHHI-4" /NCGR_SAMPLE_ID=MMETSP0368 /ASSEMBLY_ACC=CAM_ASM_000363 /LENGTH=163 /DNA_ID=CAMNT_0018769841 /DNA_START=489 /DNA_END=980 /DNA_ORIENTATION=-